MTYTELVAAIEAYAENYDTSTGGFVDNIPVFVKNAEQRIYNSVQLPSLRKNVIGTLTVNNKYLACPVDFLASYSMAVIRSCSAFFSLENIDSSVLFKIE
jgi:hydroxymethylglutaryl-CoA reductase